MIEESKTYKQMTFTSMSVSTCSPESVDGSERSNLRGGRGLSGPGVVHANRSATPGKGKGLKTSDTSGRKCEDLSPSASLQRSLENRLQARLDVNGSPEYALTWKRWDMQSGEPICALRASGRRTSGKDFSGWPTCMVEDARRGNKPPRPHDTGVPLSQMAVLAGWPTCSARDWRSDQSIKTDKEIYGSKGRPLSRTVLGATSTSSTVQTEKPGALNPDHSRWLMGYPREWLSCVDWETLSSRKSQRNS